MAAHVTKSSRPAKHLADVVILDPAVGTESATLTAYLTSSAPMPDAVSAGLTVEAGERLVPHRPRAGLITQA
jgi:hypothetical protein